MCADDEQTPDDLERSMKFSEVPPIGQLIDTHREEESKAEKHHVREIHVGAVAFDSKNNKVKIMDNVQNEFSDSLDLGDYFEDVAR